MNKFIRKNGRITLPTKKGMYFFVVTVHIRCECLSYIIIIIIILRENGEECRGKPNSYPPLPSIVRFTRSSLHLHLHSSNQETGGGIADEDEVKQNSKIKQKLDNVVG